MLLRATGDGHRFSQLLFSRFTHPPGDKGRNVLWGLPALFRGKEIHSEGDPVLNLNPAVARLKGVQDNNLRLLAKLNAAGCLLPI